MAADPYRIAAATGVDVRLDIAGPGSRSYAFIIDWHIRLLLALAWFAGVALLERAGVRFGLKPAAAQAWIAVAPALVIYFFYHPVLEVLQRGRTPGKRMAGVRIVTRSGGTPTVAALLLRNLFRLVDALPGLYCVGLVTAVFTTQRIRVGDLVAGTLLVHAGEEEVQALARLGSLAGSRSLDAASVSLASELLGRWPQLAPERRSRLARELLRRIAPAGEPGLEGVDEEGLRLRIEAVLRGETAA